MDGAYFTLVASLGGVTIGGLTSFATSWTTLRAQMKANGSATSKSRRRDLYKSFVVNASKVYGDALIHNKPELSDLIDLHAIVSLMRVNSSATVIENAVQVIRTITETYTQPNKSPEEIEAMIENGSIDLLQAFSKACRAELEGNYLL